jgi:hypothetical protein
MAGPYPPHRPVGGEGYPYQPGYPGALPPPVNYPLTPRRPRLLWWSLAGLGLVGAVLAGILAFAVGRPTGGSAAFNNSAVTSAIQNYLTALSDGDTETVARNTACGMFDAITERKSDLALARLSSDAFRTQFTRADVTSIDKIVPTSSYQAQVLFTMRVAPATGSRNARDEQQGVAQLLRQDNQLLVCSYLLRTSAQY